MWIVYRPPTLRSRSTAAANVVPWTVVATVQLATRHCPTQLDSEEWWALDYRRAAHQLGGGLFIWPHGIDVDDEYGIAVAIGTPIAVVLIGVVTAGED